MAEANGKVYLLILKHLKGELNSSEKELLQDWIHSSDENRAIFHELTDPARLETDLKEFHETRINIQTKIAERIREQELTALSTPARRHVIPRIWRYIAAASVLLLVVGAWLWMHRNPGTARASSNDIVLAKNDIAPGGNKATLTLSNGSAIVLDTAVNGHLARQGNAMLTKANDQLSYMPTGSQPAAANGYNSLTTPKAGQFRLVLPDGTKVWLNNATSLRYPTSFAAGRREVSLTGEAYFEVAADPSKPFMVQIDNSLAIHVLGTSFNIMAYKDERSVITTLLTGKLELATGSKKSMLMPGEKAIAGQEGDLKIEKVGESEDAIAWKRGYFSFHRASLSDVLRQLSRWYDVQVEFTAPLSAENASSSADTFDGEIDRGLGLSSILRHLEKKELHFRIDGKRLIVYR